MAGITPDHAGYATIIGPGKTKEADTCTCAHCNRIWNMRANDPAFKPQLGGWCRLCSKPICPRCDGKGCMPFLKKLEMYERRQDLFKQLGLTL